MNINNIINNYLLCSTVYGRRLFVLKFLTQPKVSYIYKFKIIDKLKYGQNSIEPKRQKDYTSADFEKLLSNIREPKDKKVIFNASSFSNIISKYEDSKVIKIEKQTSINSSFEEIYNLKKNKVKKVDTTQNQIVSNDISIKRSKLALPDDDIINIQQHTTFAQSSLSGISRKALYASMEATNNSINKNNLRNNKENQKIIKEDEVKVVNYIRF